MSSYEKEQVSIARKIRLAAIGIFVGLLVIICLFRCFYSVDEQHNAVVTQFGSIVKVDTAGLHFHAPFIESAVKIYTGDMLYDVPTSDVITADNKSYILVDEEKFNKLIASLTASTEMLEYVGRLAKEGV